MEDDAGIHAQALGPGFEHQPVGFAGLLQHMRMGGAEHDVHSVRIRVQDRGQRIDHVLHALVRRQEPEREDHGLALDAKPVLVAGGKHRLRNSVRNQVDLVGTDSVDLLEQGRTVGAHHHQSFRQAHDLVQHPSLRRVRIGEDGVQRRDDRHAQLTQEREDRLTRLAAEDAVLVLQRDGVHHRHIEEVHGPAVRRDVVLLDLEAHSWRVVMARAAVVHGHDEAIQGRELGGDGRAQVGGERRNAALAREVVAQEGNPRQGLRNRRMIVIPPSRPRGWHRGTGVRNCESQERQPAGTGGRTTG